MNKWQYIVLDSKEASGGGFFGGKAKADIESYLNKLGSQGWEIIKLDFRELDNIFEFTGVAKKQITD